MVYVVKLLPITNELEVIDTLPVVIVANVEVIPDILPEEINAVSRFVENVLT